LWGWHKGLTSLKWNMHSMWDTKMVINCFMYHQQIGKATRNPFMTSRWNVINIEKQNTKSLRIFFWRIMISKCYQIKCSSFAIETIACRCGFHTSIRSMEMILPSIFQWIQLFLTPCRFGWTFDNNDES
jgi:hypothetical protein